MFLELGGGELVGRLELAVVFALLLYRVVIQVLQPFNRNQLKIKNVFHWSFFHLYMLQKNYVEIIISSYG